MVDGDGEVTDFLRLPHIMKRRNGWNKDDAELKVTAFVSLSSNYCDLKLELAYGHCQFTGGHDLLTVAVYV